MKTIYEIIFDKLIQVVPLDMIEKGVESGKSLVGKGQEQGSAFMDLHYDYLRKDPQGHIIALSHYYKHPSGDMIADPDMEIRVIPSMKMAEAMTYQDTYGYQQVYNSHGGWSTLSDIRETELERGNVFPHISYPDNTPAIWICFTRRKALRYVVPADDWERVDDETKPLTKSETEMMRFDVQEIDLLPTDVIVHDDGDEGYLLLRPTKQTTLFPWMK